MISTISNTLSNIHLHESKCNTCKVSIQDDNAATSCNACFQAIYCNKTCKRNDLTKHKINCEILFLNIQPRPFKETLDGNSSGIFNAHNLVDILFKFYKPLLPKIQHAIDLV